MADGKIVIDARIRVEKAQKELKDLQRESEKTADAFKKQSKEYEKASSDRKAVTDLQETQYKAAETKEEFEAQSEYLDEKRNKALSEGQTPAQFEKANKADIKDADKLAKEVEKQEKASTKAAESFQAWLNTVAEAKAEVQQLENALDELNQKEEAAKQKVEESEAALESATRAQERREKLSAFGSALGSGIGKIGKTLVSGFGKGVAAVGRFNKALLQSNRHTGTFHRWLKRIVSGALVFNIISKAVRSLASYMGTVIQRDSGMAQALANLKGAAYTAAQPIVAALLPAMKAAATAAATLLNYIAKLAAALSGKSLSALKANASAMYSLGKASQKTLASFDEINQLGQSGSGSTIDPNFAYDATSGLLDSMMAAIEGGDWKGAGQLLADKLNSLVEQVDASKWGAKLGSLIQKGLDFANGFMYQANWTGIGVRVAEFLNSALKSIDPVSVGESLVSTLVAAIRFLNGAIKTIDWRSVGQNLSKMFHTALTRLTDAVNEFDWAALGNAIADYILGIDWAQLIKDMWNLGVAIIGGLWEGMASVMKKLGDWVEQTIEGWRQSINNWLDSNLGGIFHINSRSDVRDQILAERKGSIGNRKIPGLAAGAVIPANQRFLAMLGDQTSGVNVEAPLSTIKQAVEEALIENGGGNVNVRFTGDLAQLARVLRPVIEREGKRQGGALVKGGTY